MAEELAAVDAGPLLTVLNQLDASPGRTAVVDLAASGVALVRWLKRNPQAVAGLVAVPRVVAGVVAHAGVFTGERLVERFMAAGELHAVLEAHPGVVGAVLGDVEVLETALSSPGVVAAAAADPGVLRLLKRYPVVRGLVRSGADAAGLVLGSAQVRRALGAVPHLAEALAESSRLRADVGRAPWTVGVLERNHRMVVDARENGVLWRAVVASEVLAGALSPRVRRQLTGLVAFLQERPGFAERFVGTPALLELAAVGGAALADGLRRLERERPAVIERGSGAEVASAVEAVMAPVSAAADTGTTTTAP
ncbi:hypothetical protein, partial [Streptomyces sp. NRRL S-31]|uniref:hypothetical protein n=1 Tax=Streptomyces sp. NRRL S-31 TaxID=1463898 RepID=UPI00131CA0B9